MSEQNFNPANVPSMSMEELERVDEKEIDISTKETQSVDLTEVEETMSSITEIIKSFIERHPNADEFSLELTCNSKQRSIEEKENKDNVKDKTADKECDCAMDPVSTESTLAQATDQTPDPGTVPTESVEDMIRRVESQIITLQADIKVIKEWLTPVDLPVPKVKEFGPLRVNLTAPERASIINEIKRQRKIGVKEIKKYLKKHYPIPGLFRS